MNFKFSFFLILTILLTGCSLGDNTTQDIPNYREEWHLTESSGGTSGTTSTFELETVIWQFNGETTTLTVTNNNTDDTKEDLFSSGTYSFSQETVSNSSYLTVNGVEYGEVIFTTSSAFTLDGSSTSTGPVTDAYSYEFKRVLVEIE